MISLVYCSSKPLLDDTESLNNTSPEKSSGHETIAKPAEEH
jgi:hypothetical protein